MEQNEQLITQWAPALLNMQMDALLWQGHNEMNVGELWKLLCTYCYLPRLASFEVLQACIQRGVDSEEYFAYADGVLDGKYVGLKYNQPVGIVDRSGYIVTLSAALKQLVNEKQPATKVEPPVPPVNDGAGDVPPPPVPPQPQNRRFHMTATLDNTRILKNAASLMDEVINHLTQLDGATVEIKLLVDATMPAGAPMSTVRTVTENCRTLRVDDFGFEE